MARVLYITYDGLLEPLGESQVLQYLERLSFHNEISLISYEKAADLGDADRMEQFMRRTKAASISWHPRRYHKAPSVPATAYDIVMGYLTASRIVRKRKVQIIHARGYVPSLIALMLAAKRDIKFIFDMRGFWPDEKVDAGTWRRGSRLYNWAKRLERAALLRADVVVSLTEAGVRSMQRFEYLVGGKKDFRVIPTCTNMQLFHPPATPLKRDILNVGYVGNAGGWYLFEPMLESFRHLLDIEPDARLTVINRDQHDLIWKQIRLAKIPEASVTVESCRFEEVGEAMRLMSASIFFIKPVYSKLASAPTKLGEFLASGVPCMVNDGVGDMGDILRETGVGVVVDSVEPGALAMGVRRLISLARDQDVRDACVEVARTRFSLESGVASYSRIYRELLSPA